MVNTIRRQIRSFVRRDGRMTVAQHSAIQEGLPQFGLKLDEGFIDFSAVFKRQAPRILEIGFGNGVSMLSGALAHPDHDFIGIETHLPGIGHVLMQIMQKQIQNIRICYGDAVEVLKRCISDQELDAIQCFFPDPWPKRRHHKRRLIQPEFVSMLAMKLKRGGTLHLATDWQDYAEHMMKVLSSAKTWVNGAGTGQFAERSTKRPVMTKFEHRAEISGRKIWELQFIKSY